jgi:hypothetical protein
MLTPSTFPARWPLLTLCLMLSTFVGCQASVESQLTGKWRGTPDSRQAASERKAKLEKNGATQNDTENDAPVTVEDNPEAEARRTDLEGVDVVIDLVFGDDGKVAMTRVSGESYRGVWRVIERIPPQGAEIEIGRLADEAPSAKEKEGDTEPKIAEKRRFTIDFQKDGETDGFLLKEKGADPQFGRLYFRRVE